jgi:AcrR family transcriptional regulator
MAEARRKAPLPELRSQGSALTPRGQRTREALVLAARAEFEVNGFVDATIQGIATRADVAYGTFYTYFASKDEIFREVVDALVENFRAVAAAEPSRGTDPASRIARANAGFLHAYRTNAAMMAILEQVATISPQLATVRRDARRFWVKRSTAAFTKWQADGLIDGAIDPYYAASALGSMVDRSAYLWYVLGEPFNENTAINQLTRLYCNALGIAPARATQRNRRTPKP